MQTKQNKEAQSTVQDETADNVVLAVRHFKLMTGVSPILVLDNIKIQANIPDLVVASRYGFEALDPGCRIRIPTYSPDFNQVAEHTVGGVKRCTRNRLYDCSGNLQSRSLQHIVREVVLNDLHYDAVVKNVLQMPTTWGIISTPVGCTYTDAEGKDHNGSGGWWTPSFYG